MLFRSRHRGILQGLVKIQQRQCIDIQVELVTNFRQVHFNDDTSHTSYLLMPHPFSSLITIWLSYRNILGSFTHLGAASGKELFGISQQTAIECSVWGDGGTSNSVSLL